MKAISIRLDMEDIAKVESIAEAKGLSYITLLRMRNRDTCSRREYELFGDQRILDTIC